MTFNIAILQTFYGNNILYGYLKHLIIARTFWYLYIPKLFMAIPFDIYIFIAVHGIDIWYQYLQDMFIAMVFGIDIYKFYFTDFAHT